MHACDAIMLAVLRHAQLLQFCRLLWVTLQGPPVPVPVPVGTQTVTVGL